MEHSGAGRPSSPRAGACSAAPELRSLDAATSALDTAVLASPADETEIVWWEVRRSRTAHAVTDADSYRRLEQSALIRVREGKCSGGYRLDAPDPGSLSMAIRQAIAHARAEAPSGPLMLPDTSEPEPAFLPAFDPHLADLDPAAARRWLAQRAEAGEAAILEWAETRMVIRNSRGLLRRAKATSITLEVRSGDGASAGFGTNSARSFEGLSGETVFTRARRRRAAAPALAGAERAASPLPIVLSAEAMIELITQLNLNAFSARAYREGTSFLRQHRGVQVFDRRFALRDDGTDRGGLAFPFDLEGRTKHPVDLVLAGVPKTPALDGRTARELGLQPTGHALGSDDAFALHLVMAPGQAVRAQLLGAAEGGLWVGRLDRVAVFDPARMRFVARCRGVRRIRDAEIAEAVPELSWEDSLLRVFSNFIDIGNDCVTRASRDGVLGATVAPATAIAGIAELKPAD